MVGVDLDRLGDEEGGRGAGRWGRGKAGENKVLNIHFHKYMRCVRAANQHRP